MVDLNDGPKEVAERFVRSEDPSVVVDTVRSVAAFGPRARIARLANVLHEVDILVGPRKALALYGSLEHPGRASEYPEFLPILLYETSKVAHRFGRSQTAASYALGAARHALFDGQTVLAANVLRLSQRDGIL